MSHKLAEPDEVLNEVNVIPLADLSLVLLIILMVISPLIGQGMIQLMQAKAQAAEIQEQIAQPETPIIVSLEPTALRLNGTVMGSEFEFGSKLQQMLFQRKDRSVHLTVEPTVAHGKAVQTMNLIQRFGSDNLVVLKYDASEFQPAAIAERTTMAAHPTSRGGRS